MCVYVCMHVPTAALTFYLSELRKRQPTNCLYRSRERPDTGIATIGEEYYTKGVQVC